MTDAIKVDGTYSNGSSFLVGQAKIKSIAEDHDICILEFPHHGLTPLILAANTDYVETEDRITVIGAPGTFFPVRREGHIIAVKAGSDLGSMKDLIFMSIDIQPGSSGSPVIWNGKVIGVLVILVGRISNAALAENVSNLHELLNNGDQ